jgi:hypothetical protein
VAQEKNELKTLCEKYSTVVYQMGHTTEDPDPYFWLTDPVPVLGGAKNMRIRIPNTVIWKIFDNMELGCCHWSMKIVLCGTGEKWAEDAVWEVQHGGLPDGSRHRGSGSGLLIDGSGSGSGRRKKHADPDPQHCFLKKSLIIWNLGVVTEAWNLCCMAQENNVLKTLCEKYNTVVYQMGHTTEDPDPYFWLTDQVPVLGGAKNMRIRIPNTVFWKIFDNMELGFCHWSMKIVLCGTGEQWAEDAVWEVQHGGLPDGSRHRGSGSVLLTDGSGSGSGRRKKHEDPDPQHCFLENLW